MKADDGELRGLGSRGLWNGEHISEYRGREEQYELVDVRFLPARCAQDDICVGGEFAIP